MPSNRSVLFPLSAITFIVFCVGIVSVELYIAFVERLGGGYSLDSRGNLIGQSFYVYTVICVKKVLYVFIIIAGTCAGCLWLDKHKQS